ncbi:hypothetical protein QOT17_011235 [Balamuthia mandrillaris]
MKNDDKPAKEEATPYLLEEEQAPSPLSNEKKAIRQSTSPTVAPTDKTKEAKQKKAGQREPDMNQMVEELRAENKALREAVEETKAKGLAERQRTQRDSLQEDHDRLEEELREKEGQLRDVCAERDHLKAQLNQQQHRTFPSK